VKSKETNTR